MKSLPLSFYEREDVVTIAQELLGKGLFTNFGTQTGGIIIETEAYAGIEDRASHAYSGRRTPRNEVMYGSPGIAYVYLCYGIHALFNAVTAPEGIPHAVLIRAIIPTHGIKTMLSRRKKQVLDQTLTSGPGALTAALGISCEHKGLALDHFIYDLGHEVKKQDILISTRIGIDYAGSDALLPYRFSMKRLFMTSRND